MKKLTARKTLLVLTYNRTLPNISEVVRKNCHILQINPEFGNVSVNKPTIVSKRNKNMQDLIGGYLVKDGKVAKKKLVKRQCKSKNVIQQDQPYVVCKCSIIIHSKVT